ncbi:hypothetical protein A2210_02910 [Candidatus Woesebacteria bacterium RIFOXYA1_FULL_40_18]|uniref:Glyoxalase/fosfomycin resistance/dioxygenase domain-containing protein n=3 Tax=Candidatus Woeseibacteriota TaxID=1752722 RepID=A0A1F8CIG1_9BACT|nr:MAG: hypothetical protein A2210_02910 [Candidatus Woesebacteria bacterium RIFOXYA1_FULL_40_18]OGM80310.1 MAG: hypothetical protein A2361_01775 [Candidatus Woesebacteria bacterium RIFOXYB1_FULL_40_26]OGM87175.1 MAG: hypothetical protein A2614_01890 [Candidatus Woesebacteria bacterium RIFOXYD1_FULL_40_21]
MKPVQNNVLLELHVPDFEKVKEYYGKLGFKVIWERKPEGFKGYLILKMSANILCFWAGNEHVYEHPFFKRFSKDTPRGYGVEIVIMVDDIESYYKKVKGFANVVEELTLQPWSLKDFRTADPFGYYLRFTSYHDILDNGNAVP